MKKRWIVLGVTALFAWDAWTDSMNHFLPMTWLLAAYSVSVIELLGLNRSIRWVRSRWG